ncbi:hypothetical protein IFM89_035378 [Coptis chinensis]|uniref:Endonuclease/exonuclease/phosphatase domain-containing protein n=1 Tax=Coptis chinensis TaxID=261450 RepID=A0A835IUL4_9MAGN|nr:hypothetical protein IFM89_035378 [Coptis chinensis]
MRYLFWNIRGIGNSRSQERLKKLIKELDPDFVGIAEPKIAHVNFISLQMQALGMHHSVITNDTGQRVPNLWLFWKATLLNPIVLSVSYQHITVECQGLSISIVHAHSLYLYRRQLWQDLSHICSLQIPTLIIGDFNSYLSTTEKKGGRWPSSTAMGDFREWMDNNFMLEAPCSGLFYTWSNKRRGSKRIMGRLDRAFYNKEWQDSFPNWGLKAVARLCSDHAPLIGWHESIPKPRNAPFKFFNMWLSHSDFMAVVKNSCEEYIEGHELFILAQKLKRLKDDESWTQQEFESNVVKEHEGKRPLLSGDLQVTSKEGVGTLGELTFT